MNLYKQRQSRRLRRIPLHQRSPSRQMYSFWPTFRGALAWMKKNQETVNTAIGLLEIYPSLIQDRCMDRFWEFIQPYNSPEGAAPYRKSELGHKPDKTKSSTVRNHSHGLKKVPIPTISVTMDLYDDNDDIIKDSDINQRKIKMYLSGQTQTDNLPTPFAQLTTDLNSEYNVHPCIPSTYSSSKVCEALADSDIFVFQMSQESVMNPTSYRDLSAAWTMNIPMLFIKPPEFKLPNPLPDSVILGSLERQNKSSRFGSGKMFSHSVPPNLTPMYRNGTTLPSIRSSSTQELHFEKKHQLVQRDSCDLVLLLINGYRNASVWDPINQQQSFESVKNRIEKLLTNMYTPSPTPISGTSQNFFPEDEETIDLEVNPKSLLQVPTLDTCSPLNVSMEDLHVDDDKASVNLPAMSPSSTGQSLSDQEDVEKETFYVVFKDRHSPGNVIKWPLVSDEVADDVFADSPISFKDVDLSLKIKMDSDRSDSDT